MLQAAPRKLLAVFLLGLAYFREQPFAGADSPFFWQLGGSWYMAVTLSASMASARVRCVGFRQACITRDWSGKPRETAEGRKV